METLQSRSNLIRELPIKNLKRLLALIHQTIELVWVYLVHNHIQITWEQLLMISILCRNHGITLLTATKPLMSSFKAKVSKPWQLKDWSSMSRGEIISCLVWIVVIILFHPTSMAKCFYMEWLSNPNQLMIRKYMRASRITLHNLILYILLNTS